MQEGVVTSADGTVIAYRTTGSGPGVIFIPGALSTAETYSRLAEELGNHFSVHTIERRGRGRSGPMGESYSIKKEREDVEALLARTAATYLFGHSFGGLVALETARHNASVDKVAVYEPGVSIKGSIPMSWMEPYRRHLASGRRLDAFAEFVRGVGPLRAQQTPLWLMKMILRLVMRRPERALRLQLLEANLAEHQEVARLDGSYWNYREVAANVLLMIGGKTDGVWAETAAAGLTDVLPRSEVKRFADLSHFGPDKEAPGIVARDVAAFFGRPSHVTTGPAEPAPGVRPGPD